MPQLRKISKAAFDHADVEPIDASGEQRFVCADCAAEGKAEPQPASAFYVYRHGTHKERSKLCRRHYNRRRNDRLAAQLDPESADYDPKVHAAVKQTKRSYAQRKLNPTSPEYDAALHKRQLIAKAAWREKQRTRDT